jgi:2-polyprenyl-3-methyl-5-hydroxy-6-metoxy-1,4-benzoquinol methylase
MPLAHTRVFRCGRRDCDLQFAAPQLDDHELAQAYASLYYRPDGSDPVLENTPEVDIRHLLERLSAQFGSPAGKRVLDYGCGVGTLLKVANDLGAFATGVEQSATAREQIETAGFATVYANLEALRRAEPEIQFDWIILCEVIEHLRRPWEDLQKLRPLLKPSGDLVILTPNFDALRSRVSGARWDQRMNLTHLYYFTPHSLSAVLRRAGFTPSEMPPVSWYSNHGLMRRQIQRALCAAGLQGSLMFSGKATEPVAAKVAV